WSSVTPAVTPTPVEVVVSEPGPGAASGSNASGGDGRRPARPPIHVLDPATAKRQTSGDPQRPALYLSNRLIARDLSADTPRDTESDDPLREALKDLRLAYRVDRRPGRSRDVRDAGWGTTITLLAENPTEPVDAWSTLQDLRQRLGRLVEGLSLDHVLRPADGYWGGVGGYWGGVGGYWGGVGGYWGGVGGSALAEYSVPGRGGRMPVALALPDPALRARSLDRNPVIALLDTPIADHPWFRDTARVVRLRYEDGTLVPEPVPPVTAAASTPPTDAPAPVQPAGLLQGHATFIAGLIRQGCPEATILSVPVMDDDGVVDESHLLDVLEALLARHLAGQKRGGARADVVDILSLSMGYYAEDLTFTSGPVHAMLDRLAEAGVIVVAGAGNDGTDAPFVPASLAAALPKPSDPQVAPVSSVGASNPNGATVALFSNPLTVISAVRAGVSLVSTLPLTDGMGQPSSSVTGLTGVRCTVDPDDYTGGFGIWSGTSFATPVFAAEVAAALAAGGPLKNVTAAAMCTRSLAALRSCTGKDPK
ncbi:MAG: S8/S53 family peptidase, partial [Humibacillus sp.]